MSNNYSKDLINREVLTVCDHYLTHRRKEGKRQSYQCPVCGERRFEVEPNRGHAGCFDPACEAPTTTDALGIIAYFEEKDLSGKGFVECLQKGYEILGIPDPRETRQGRSGQPEHTPSGESSSGESASGKSRSAGGEKAMTPHREKAMTPKKRRPTASSGSGKESSMRDDRHARRDGGNRWVAAGDEAGSRQSATLEQPVQAWQEHLDGSRSPIEAVIIREPEATAQREEAVEEADPATSKAAAGEPEDSANGHSPRRGYSPRPDEREKAHEIYKEFLKLCPRESRDERFLGSRGLDGQTIEDGRFGSMSKERCGYVLSKLKKKFSEEELLSVPGFYRVQTGRLRCSLYGDYALIPYFDRDGYIRTVEGRFTGEEMGEYDKKYKAPIHSGVHLYVHPRFVPDEVVAICEGAIGAMVAARYGFAVASIKGMHNYRQAPAEDRGEGYSILPQLEGVDFAGGEVVYIPDLDVKEKTREKALSLVPEACEWLIERQGGVARVAMLPEGAKDLDAWIMSLEEEERDGKLQELLVGAYSLEEFKVTYLNSDESRVSQGGPRKLYEKPEAEEVGGEVGGEVSEPGAPEEATNREGASGAEGSHKDSSDDDTTEMEACEPEGSRDEEQANSPDLSQYETDSQPGDDDPQPRPGEQPTNNLEETSGNANAKELEPESQTQGGGTARKIAADDDAAPNREAKVATAPLVPTADGEGALVATFYVVAAILLTVALTAVFGEWLIWAQYAGLGAGISIWVASGFTRLRRWQTTRRLQRHVEGADV